MKKQTGIWLDVRNAWIINLPLEQEGAITTHHIVSSMEENPAVTETIMSTEWGPHGGNNQKTIQERQHHEEKHYYDHILKSLDSGIEELVIFGPSEAKYGLENLLQAQHNPLNIEGVVAVDHMTEPQREAWVREYFDRPAPRLLPR